MQTRPAAPLVAVQPPTDSDRRVAASHVTPTPVSMALTPCGRGGHRADGRASGCRDLCTTRRRGLADSRRKLDVPVRDDVQAAVARLGEHDPCRPAHKVTPVARGVAHAPASRRRPLAVTPGSCRLLALTTRSMAKAHGGAARGNSLAVDPEACFESLPGAGARAPGGRSDADVARGVAAPDGEQRVAAVARCRAWARTRGTMRTPRTRVGGQSAAGRADLRDEAALAAGGGVGRGGGGSAPHTRPHGVAQLAPRHDDARARCSDRAASTGALPAGTESPGDACSARGRGHPRPCPSKPSRRRPARRLEARLARGARERATPHTGGTATSLPALRSPPSPPPSSTAPIGGSSPMPTI